MGLVLPWARTAMMAVGIAANATVVLSAAPPPNLIVILADDSGYECVTANGGESYQTPHLDRLAATGMRFEQCHYQPLCTPASGDMGAVVCGHDGAFDTWPR